MVDFSQYSERELEEIKDYNSWDKFIIAVVTLGISFTAICLSIDHLFTH